MALAETIFEQLHGKYTIERFINIISKQQDAQEHYHPKITKKLKASIIAGAFLGFTLVDFKNSSFISSLAFGGVGAFVTAWGVEVGFSDTFFKTKIGQKIASFFKGYKEIETEYKTALRYLRHHLSTLSFQSEIFHFLKKIEKQINNIEQNKHVISLYKNIVLDLINSLEKFFSLEQYDKAMNVIINNNKNLVKIMVFIEEDNKLKEYKDKLDAYNPKLQVFKSEIAHEQNESHVVQSSNTQVQYAYQNEEDILLDYRTKV